MRRFGMAYLKGCLGKTKLNLSHNTVPLYGTIKGQSLTGLSFLYRNVFFLGLSLVIFILRTFE